MPEAQQTPDEASPQLRVGSVRNLGDPIRFVDVESLAGFAAEAHRPGETVNVISRISLTSDDPLFHRLAEGLMGVLGHMATKAGIYIRPDRADTLLFVIKADNTAELWLDTAAVSLRCMVKRTVTAGTAIFEGDVADITGMSFPCVNIEVTDRIICIFRQDWRFAMAFDFNPDRQLSIEEFTTTLGTLYRELRYRHLYDALANQTLFTRIISTGWFPFIEIIGGEFRQILSQCEAGFDVREIEDSIIGKFDDTRMNIILERWLAKPHYARRETMLKAAISAYNRQDPISVIKILLTEIEGILADAYRAAHDGKRVKLNELLKFAIESAERRAGVPDTLLFPAAFARYLANYTFANFDPAGPPGEAGSRHAVGHGEARPDSYTMTRALQAILTLDQLAFYT